MLYSLTKEQVRTDAWYIQDKKELENVICRSIEVS